MQDIKYSIILPVYNGEKTIRKAIESVLSQNQDGFELIIVNDGSSDKTSEICKEYAKSNIVVIDKHNSGVSDSRNTGINLAKGKYILFLDADDKITEDALQIIDNIVDNDDADLICFDYDELLDEKIIKKRECNQYGKFVGKTEIDQLMKFSLRQSQWYLDKWYGNFRPVWNKCFKKEVIDKYNIRFESGLRIGEDMTFVINMLNHSNEVIITEKKYYIYSNNPESVMHSRKWSGPDQGEMYFKAVEGIVRGRVDDYDLRELWLETAENDWMIICKSELSRRNKIILFNKLLERKNYIRFSKTILKCTSVKEMIYLLCIRLKLAMTLYTICSIRANKH